MDIIAEIKKRHFAEKELGIECDTIFNVSMDLLEKDLNFCEEVNEPTMFSLALSLAGNSPIKNYRFNEGKMIKILNENNIDYIWSSNFIGYVFRLRK